MISKQGNAPAHQLTNKDQSTVSGMGHGGEINHMSPQMGRFVDTKYSTGAWRQAKPDPWLSGIKEFYFTWVLPASVQYHMYLGRERNLKFRRPSGPNLFSDKFQI